MITEPLASGYESGFLRGIGVLKLMEDELEEEGMTLDIDIMSAFTTCSNLSKPSIMYNPRRSLRRSLIFTVVSFP
jgi:hypothetical protein